MGEGSNELGHCSPGAEHRLALREDTCERDPVGWAKDQFNMGLAIDVLGERTRSTDRLTEALACFQQAGPVFQAAGISHLSEESLRIIARLQLAVATPPGATSNLPKPGG